MATIHINNQQVEIQAGNTLLQVAKRIGIDIPTLCYMDWECFDQTNSVGSCRICVVEVEGRPNLAPACCTPAIDGMVVATNTARAINARRTVLDLLLSDHPKECLTCKKSMDCQLQKLATDMHLHRIRYEGEMSSHAIDQANESIVRDMNKCIMCRRCETACNEIQKVGILSAVGRGFGAIVAPTASRPLIETPCTFCGQCVSVCPVGALTEMDRVSDVWKAINDPDKLVIVQTAPAVRVAIGEEFDMAAGTIATGKMVSALRMLGFDKVFDTDFAADLTIMEETHELIERVKKNENLPILTSCCPGWVNFLEYQFADLVNIPSTAKSPQQMFGAIAKTYYAEKIGVKPENMVVVSVMPCLAKKHEASLPKFAHNGVRDVDIVISTRELARMIKEAGVNLAVLEDSAYDNPLGESTGAAVIFGASGGVLEAALRTAVAWLSGDSTNTPIDFKAVRGLEQTKEATVRTGDLELRAAITSGLGDARAILEKVRRGEANYHAIEIMACPGGCLNGSGQPYSFGKKEILEARMRAIYEDDRNTTIRKSHENPYIKQLYAEFLGEPGSHKAHELLHTNYRGRQSIIREQTGLRVKFPCPDVE